MVKQLTDQEQALLEQLELLLRTTSIDVARRRLGRMVNDFAVVDRIIEVRQSIAEQTLRMAAEASLTGADGRASPWYTGPQPDDHFWPKLERKLLDDPGWRPAVPAISQASTDIVSLLADPHSPSIRTRGLVLGYVQSGKTANFTATIAKAADAGYRLFIVLSGMHNALRRQTQIRLDEQLYELNKVKWLQLTDEGADFGNPVKALALVNGTDLRLLAVVKKNPSRLTRLRDWLMQAHEEGGLDTCPVLIIDDESDQASPNASKNALDDRTTVNQRIVELLQLPRVAYVGYTATPFANVLVNPSDVEDIYPRDFIYSLPKPDTYFGSQELFGLSDAVVDEDELPDAVQPHDMIREVSEDEAAQHVVRKGEPHSPQVTPALGEAIRWFILATSARRRRTGEHRHSSMLVHTTMRVEPQLSYLPEIRQYVKKLAAEWHRGERAVWAEQWSAEQQRESPRRHGHAHLEFEDLVVTLPGVLAELKVVADNSRSTERLLYGDDPATVIAVGGNTLSRGLTLEGLVSSYFLRSSSAYDSLLQMGRWFGYRPGYEDLPRIWTTKRLAQDFRFLAEVEDGLRSEVDTMRIEGATPAQMPMRIRTHPRMQVTAKAKMQFAVPGEASYGGQRPQTTYFNHRSSDVLRNQDAARELIAKALSTRAQLDRQDSRILLRGVAADDIAAFINAYRFHDATDLSSEQLSMYLARQREAGALETWNVAVITRRNPGEQIDLGLDEQVNLITRSRLKNSSDASTACIGTLMSRPDRVADLMESAAVVDLTDGELLDARNSSQRGLLILYPIDKDSKPKPSTESSREALGAANHIIGVGFSFPSSVPGSEPVQTVQVNPVLLAGSDSNSDFIEDTDDTEGDHDVDLNDD